MTEDYTGQNVVDGDGRVYEITHHHIEADELQIERGDITTAITLMDVADGPYTITDPEETD
jgi:hypothetical protein